jgi:hypothetical protein
MNCVVVAKEVGYLRKFSSDSQIYHVILSVEKLVESIDSLSVIQPLQRLSPKSHFRRHSY